MGPRSRTTPSHVPQPGRLSPEFWIYRSGSGIVDQVEDIVLMPLGGATRTTRFPERPGDELAMVLVGPMTSLALAGSAGMGSRLLAARM